MREGCGNTVMNHMCRGHNSKDLEIFALLNQGQKYADLPAKHRRYRDDIFDDKYRRLKANQPCWTLTAHMQKDCLAYIHPRQTRTLSAREAARIQSFPDSFIFEGPLTKIFRQVGNAVPPLLAERVALELVPQLSQRRSELLFNVRV
jgi:DNA (cytosine-5)-methyltransferase 1